MDLTTHYGSLLLSSPVVIGACPLTMEDSFRQAVADAGAGAVVLPSIFAEQLPGWRAPSGQSIDPIENRGLHPSQMAWPDPACGDAAEYLRALDSASAKHDIPVIASINGIADAAGIDFAKKLESAGAAGIEWNAVGFHDDIDGDVNQRDVEWLAALAGIKQAIDIPLFLKTDPCPGGTPRFARRVVSGVDAMVLYGRGPSVDICLKTKLLRSSWTLSPPGDVQRLIRPLLETHAACPALSLAASGGIASGEDVAKSLLAGADVAMVTSAVYRDGPPAVGRMLSGLGEFMKSHRMQSLDDLRQQRPVGFSSQESRLAYVAALSTRHAE
ncbi:MAG: dihydroorotate dehydrogenase [Planctomycetota bacterium]